MSENRPINNLERTRRSRGLTQEHVSHLLAALGYRGTSILRDYEKGRAHPPLRTALALAHIYRTSVIALWSQLQEEVVELLQRAEASLHPQVAGEEVRDE